MSALAKKLSTLLPSNNFDSAIGRGNMVTTEGQTVNIVAQGNPSLTGSIRPDGFGQSLLFDGTGSAYIAWDPAFGAFSSFVAGMLIKPGLLRNQMEIMTKWSAYSDNRNCFFLWLQSTSYPQFRLTQSNSVEVDANSSVPLTTDVHRLIIYARATDGKMGIYLDGVDVGSNTYDGTLGGDAYTNVSLGIKCYQNAPKDTSSPAPFSGNIQDPFFLPGVAVSAADLVDLDNALAAVRNVPVVTTIDQVAASRSVRIFSRPTGAFIAGAVTNASGAATINVDSADAVDVIAFDDYGERWLPDTTYATSAKSFPNTPNGHWYQTSSGGVSGSNEPTWPTDGTTVTDGSVTWTDMGTMRAPVIQGPFIPVEAS